MSLDGLTGKPMGWVETFLWEACWLGLGFRGQLNVEWETSSPWARPTVV